MLNRNQFLNFLIIYIITEIQIAKNAKNININTSSEKPRFDIKSK